MNTAIILAAGISKRFGGEIPKQYLEINAKKIIDYSIETFQSSKCIDDIIIVVENLSYSLNSGQTSCDTEMNLLSKNFYKKFFVKFSFLLFK